MKVCTFLMISLLSISSYALNFEDHASPRCSEKWTKRGVVNTSMYNYCMKTEKKAFQKLGYSDSKRAAQYWYTNVTRPRCTKKWTKRGIQNFSMVEYCIKKEIDSKLDLEYELKTNPGILGAAQACFEYWRKGANVFGMTTFCLKRKNRGTSSAKTLLTFIKSSNTPIKDNLIQKNAASRTIASVSEAGLISKSALSGDREIDPKLSVPAGRFTSKNIVMGASVEELQKIASGCSISASSGAPVFNVVSSYTPPINDFFPLKQNIYQGLSSYYGWVGGLNTKFATAKKLKCGDKTYSIFFTKSKKLFGYEKTVYINAPSHTVAASEITKAIAPQCEGEVQSHDSYSNDKSYGKKHPVYVKYCKSKGLVILASITTLYPAVDGKVGVTIGYVSGRGWSEYLKDYQSSQEKKKEQNLESLSNEI